MFILSNMYSPGVIILLFLLDLRAGVNGREVPDLTFIIRNVSNTIEPICIVDKNVLDSPIGWIYPITEEKDKLPVIVSKYVPEIENYYNCNFLKSKHCSNLWEMEDWQFSKFDSHIFKPTLDSRWEDFPTLLTSSTVKEFKNRIDIPHTFELGISIRAAKNAEIFLCTGWDPHTYPCYYINIGGYDKKQVYLRKYKSIPEKIQRNDTKLDKYMGEEEILSEHEWRHFYVSLTESGNVTLTDIVKNVTFVTYKDNKAIQPIYLFIRSNDDKALWKIHTDHYIFTNKTKFTQLGPTFYIYGESLCVSLYVSMCRYCRMSFYVMINGEKQILKTVFNENEHDDLLWKKIRLLQHDVTENEVRLFVETKFINNASVSDGFWGIDDVRLCTEDEIKVTHLVTTVNWKESQVSQLSCQALDVPTWRPVQNNFITSNDAIEVTSTATTIRISWKPESDIEHHLQRFYIIQYEGKDTCNPKSDMLIKSISRQKSQGFVVARSFETLIKDLVPYTNYNITFWNVIDGNKIRRDVSTLPTDTLKKEELPSNVTVTATDSTCEIVWQKPNCNVTYGPIIYRVKLDSKNINLSSVIIDIKTNYTFKGLQPFIEYSVEITTARKLELLNDSKLSASIVYNFSTQAGVAPKVNNLEIYATGKNLAQLRFELPNNLQGKPKSIQVRWCHPLLFGNCDNDIQDLQECSLWGQKYCVDVDNLTSGFTYTFLVSVKNEESYTYGIEANITGIVRERVPGIPLNVTYRMRNCANTVDYCHLNISWMHPFNQNGTITHFDIILTESSYTFVEDSFQNIHEVLKVTQNSYQRLYNYNIKYIPCIIPYKISVRAVNDYYKGPFASTVIAANNSVAYVDPMPSYVNSTNETVIFKLPQLQSGLDGSNLIIVVQDYNKNKTIVNQEILDLEMFDGVNELCNQYGETWIALTIKLNQEQLPLIVIGDSTSSYVPQLNKTVINRPLEPDTEYCITFTIIKRINESEHIIVYHDKNLFTEPNYIAADSQESKIIESTNAATYVLPVLFVALVVACGAWLSYRYFKKKRYGTSSEHVYETMPFEDYLTDAVSNDTYDRLSHD